MKNKKLFAILTLVCFMLTLMPVAAFAADGDVAIDTSAFVCIDGDKTINKTKSVEFTFAANDKATETTTTGALNFTVWAVDASGAVSSALKVEKKSGSAIVTDSEKFNNAFEVTGAKNDDRFTVSFARAGKYTVYAGVLTDDDNSLSSA